MLKTVRLFVAVVLVKVALAASTPAQYTNEANAALQFMTELAESRVIGGTVAVQKAGQLVWTRGFGYASEVNVQFVQLRCMMPSIRGSSRCPKVSSCGAGNILRVVKMQAVQNSSALVEAERAAICPRFKLTTPSCSSRSLECPYKTTTSSPSAPTRSSSLQ